METTYMTVQELQQVSEINLITALYNKGITIEHITGAYIHIEESYYALQDAIYGNSEDGLHGRNAGK
jgi:hypothetical protein